MSSDDKGFKLESVGKWKGEGIDVVRGLNEDTRFTASLVTYKRLGKKRVQRKWCPQCRIGSQFE